MANYKEFEIERGILRKYLGSNPHVVIPFGVREIDSLWHEGKEIVSVSVPRTVVSIGIYSFKIDTLEHIEVDDRNPDFKSLDGVLYNKKMTLLIHYPSAKKEISFVVPRCVVKIDTAFNDCKALKQILIGKNVQSIANEAFKDHRIMSYEDRALFMSPSFAPIAKKYRIDLDWLRTTPEPDHWDSLTIYCEAEKAPKGWAHNWSKLDCPVVWGFEG